MTFFLPTVTWIKHAILETRKDLREALQCMCFVSGTTTSRERLNCTVSKDANLLKNFGFNFESFRGGVLPARVTAVS